MSDYKLKKSKMDIFRQQRKEDISKKKRIKSIKKLMGLQKF